MKKQFNLKSVGALLLSAAFAVATYAAVIAASALTVRAQETQMGGMQMQDMPYDLHFIDMMMMHHHEGIDMAKLVDGRSENASLKDFAAKTIGEQEKELDDLRALRDRWYADKPVMNSQMHNMPGMKMDMKMDGMNMNMEADMAKLKAAKGREFDRLFLDMMTHHHQMAVSMSKEATGKAEHAEVKELARTSLAKQQQEIAEMNRIKASVGGSTTKRKTSTKTTKTTTHKHEH